MASSKETGTTSGTKRKQSNIFEGGDRGGSEEAEAAGLFEAIDVDMDDDDSEIYDTVEALIEKGEDVNYQLVDSKEMWYPLHLSVYKGFHFVTRLLLENGANVNAKDIHGKTALHMASIWDLDTVKHLLKCGADPNIQDDEGMTALHYTEENAADAIAEWLIKNGADPYIKNKEGKTFFQHVNFSIEEDDIFRLEIVYADTRGTTCFVP